jgi:hypothetical protein
MRQQFARVRKLMVVAAVFVTAGLGVAGGGQSGSPASKIDLDRTGPQIGTRLPDFVLHDQRGQTHSLKSLLGPKGAMIVFFRSADW